MKTFLRLKTLLLAVGFFCVIQGGYAQRIALKTNGLMWAMLSPNIGAEFGISRHFTLGAEVAACPFSLGNFQPRYAVFQPELRYWFTGRAHARCFVGVAGLASEYNVRFGNTFHDGSAWGGGVTGGYSFVLADRWSLETTLGLGLVRFREKKHSVGEPMPMFTNNKKFMFAPIKAGVTFVYILR